MTEKVSVYALLIILTALVMGCTPKLQGGQVYGCKADKGDYEFYVCLHSNGLAYFAEIKKQKLVSKPIGKYEITKESIRFIENNIDTHTPGIPYTLVGSTLRVPLPKLSFWGSTDKTTELIMTKVRSPTEKEILDAVIKEEESKKKSWLWPW